MSESIQILVVEDNDFVRMQIVKYLSENKYGVVEAPNGDEALDVMGSQDVDLAIVDVRMETCGWF